MLESRSYKFGCLIILIWLSWGIGCNSSHKEIKLLLIHSSSSRFIATQLEALCKEKGYIVQTTTDLAYCTEDTLKAYNAVVLDVLIDTLNHQQQTDVERYVLAGGGLLGINLQTNYTHKWPWIESILHQEGDTPQVIEPLAIFTSIKSINKIEGITTTYGAGKACFINTYNLNRTKQNLANAVDYAIQPYQKLNYQHVNIPRMPSPEYFSDVVLIDNLSEPVDMEVLPQGHVIFLERNGGLNFFNTETYETKKIAQFNVNKEQCLGLTSVALDPDFDKNHWIYFGYSPYSDPAYQYISRFFLAEDSVILSTEKVLFKIAAETSVLSLLEFDENGYLLAGFSDCSLDESQFLEDTLLEVSSRRSPINSRQNQILQFNLYPDTTFQLSLTEARPDSITGLNNIYSSATYLHNFGAFYEKRHLNWAGISISQDTVSYTDSSGDSPNKFPYLSSGNYFTTGPVYHYDLYTSSSYKFPSYYHHKLFVVNGENQELVVATFNQYKQLCVIEPFIYDIPWDNPVRLKFSSNGSLYVLEHGPPGFVSHKNARLRQITFAKDNRPPVARIESDRNTGKIPLKVNFSAQASFDFDAQDTLRFEWIFPDTILQTDTNQVQYVFTQPGIFRPVVKVHDKESYNEASTTIMAGNAVPEITLDTEINRSFYWKSKRIPYKIRIKDEEGVLSDTTLSSAMVKLYVHYREERFHAVKPVTLDPEGTLILEAPPKDSLKDYTLVVSFKDKAINGISSHETEAVFPIRSPQLFANDADDSDGTLHRTDNKVWFTQNGGYLLFRDIDMREINHLKYRVKPLVDGFLELRLNAPNGPVVSTLRMNARENWVQYTVRVGQIEGSYDLYLVFRRPEESANLVQQRVLCMLEWISFGKERIGAFYTNPDANDLL